MDFFYFIINYIVFYHNRFIHIKISSKVVIKTCVNASLPTRVYVSYTLIIMRTYKFAKERERQFGQKQNRVIISQLTSLEKGILHKRSSQILANIFKDFYHENVFDIISLTGSRHFLSFKKVDNAGISLLNFGKKS